jgi:hypothetical protein
MKKCLLILAGCVFIVFAKAQSPNSLLPLQAIPPIWKTKKKPLNAPIVPFKNYSINPLSNQPSTAQVPKITASGIGNDIYTSSLDGMGILIPEKSNCSNMPIANYREKEKSLEWMKRRNFPEIAIPRLLPNYPIPLSQNELLSDKK